LKLEYGVESMFFVSKLKEREEWVDVLFLTLKQKLVFGHFHLQSVQMDQSETHQTMSLFIREPPKSLLLAFLFELFPKFIRQSRAPYLDATFE
jgi:hypothetical protein